MRELKNHRNVDHLSSAENCFAKGVHEMRKFNLSGRKKPATHRNMEGETARGATKSDHDNTCAVVPPDGWWKSTNVFGSGHVATSLWSDKKGRGPKEKGCHHYAVSVVDGSFAHHYEGLEDEVVTNLSSHGKSCDLEKKVVSVEEKRCE